MEEKDIIAQNIIYYRKKLGISQLELAKLLQYSNKNISKWEKGETTPSIFTLKRLAEIFDITIDDLVSVEKKVKQNPPAKKTRHSFTKWLFLAMANVILLILSATLIWVLGITQFTGFNRYMILLYITPLSALSVFIFLTCVNRQMDFVFLSLFGWLTALCVFLSFRSIPNIGFIFWVAATFQLLILCISAIINLQLFKRRKARKNKQNN